jgi:hypothetical protein
VYLLSKKYWQKHLLVLIAFLVTCTTVLHSQSFRGGINGSVVDGSGAVVAGAAVVATNDGTAVARTTVSSSAGEFSFSDMPVGTYTLTITASGFSTEKIEKVTVSAGSVYTVSGKLAVSSSVQVVNVNAATVALDTTSTTQTTDIPSVAVNSTPNNGRDFTQLLQFTPGFGGYSLGGGAGVASVNGTRSNQVNWQIEGTDNNDLWWNIPAVNQGGVSGIAGIVLPLDAIDQFSFVTSGTPESGRNAGGTVNLSIKSGTNQLHGTAYYFNRNEFFAAESPFASSVGSPKNKTRDQNYGFSVGGPIWKDKTFFFVTFEHQKFLIGNQSSSTEPSAAYQALSLGVLNYYGITENPVSKALLANLWPAAALTGAATHGNYFNPGTENGHSFNGIVKIDHNFNASNQLSVKWYAGQGSQTAPTSSYLSPYYEVAPIHVQNYSVTYNHIFTPSISNQLFAGVSYFNQVFSDADHGYDPVALGLNTGVTAPDLLGAPHLTIGPPAAGSGLTGNGTAFDPLGVTPPEGRNDITGHLDDAVSYTVGKHQFRFGGEYRQAQVDDFYQTNARGNFTFDGSQGPWNVGTSSPGCTALATKNVGKADPTTYTDSNVYFLADFLAGCISSSFIAEGNQKRQVFENTFDLFGQDAWQLTAKLNLNYGIRYDFAGSVHNPYKDLSSFDPSFSTGFAVQGENVSNLYSPFKGAVSPRVGAAYALSNSLVLRGGFGMYFDTPYMLPLLNLRGTTDSGALGIGNNPGGGDPVATASANNAVIVPNQPIFPTLGQALAGVLTGAGGSVTNAYSVNPNYRQSYTYSYNLNAQQSLGSGVIAQIGYVGTLSRHLTEVQDINAAQQGSAGAQNTRPYYSQFPGIGTVNQLESDLNSNYNSLQTLIRTSRWHGLTTQASYTWSHAMDYETGLVPYLPQNSLNIAAEYSNSDFDTRNTFSAYANYDLPNMSKGPRVLTNGWELNTGAAFHSGQPFSVVASSNTSGNGDNADRAELLPGVNPFAGVSHSIVDGSVTWFNAAAFPNAPTGTFSPTRRNLFYNPGFEDIDLSVFKNTRITERINTQFRVEMFNLFNHTNLAPVGAPQTGAGGTIGSTIGAFNGAPGIGPGEPFNTQFALKVIF